MTSGSAPSPFGRAWLRNSRRDYIVTQAASVFLEQGFAHSSLEDIAARLNITKTALYHYFSSKEEILYECFVSAWEAADRLADQAAGNGRSGREKFEHAIRSFLLNGLRSDLQIMAMRERHALSKPTRARLDKRRRARRDRLRALVADGIADGSIRPCDPTLVISLWAGIVAWLMENFRRDGRYSAEALTDQAIQLFMQGIAAPERRPAARRKRTAPAGG